jgi:hypothetical protein
LTNEEAEVVLGGSVLQSGNERLLRGIDAGLRDVGPHLTMQVARSRPIVGAAFVGLDRLGAKRDAYVRARAELDRVTLGSDVTGDAAPVPELP